MSESLEALEDLFNLLCEREHTNSEHSFYLKLYNAIENELEVLDILKRAQFQIYKLGLPDNYTLWCDTYYSIPITEEEANLIRKVLPIKGEKQ